jgi:hypothetical protein
MTSTVSARRGILVHSNTANIQSGFLQLAKLMNMILRMRILCQALKVMVAQLSVASTNLEGAIEVEGVVESTEAMVEHLTTQVEGEGELNSHRTGRIMTKVIQQLW